MAIALEASGTQLADASNPVTMAFDCNGGNLLVLGITSRSNPRGAGAPTYNAVAMTDSGEGVVDSGGGAVVEMWYLVSPAAGSNTISIPNPATQDVVPLASAWSGVDTVDPFDVANNGTGSPSANPSVAVTTSAVNELIIDVMLDNNNNVPTANSHTLISSIDGGSYSTNSQYTLNDGTGGITLTWTVPSDHWAMIVASFNPSGVGPITYYGTIAVTATGTLIFSRQMLFKRILALASTVLPTFSRWLDLHRTLATTAIGTVTFTEIHIHKAALAVTATVIAAFSSATTFKRSLTLTAIVLPVFSRVLALHRTLALTSTVIPVFARALKLKRTLAVTAVVVPTLIGRLIEEIILVCDEVVSWFLPRKQVAALVDSKTNKARCAIAAKSVRIEMPDKDVEVIECPI